MRYLIVCFSALGLAACAGSPLHTSSMSPAELRGVDTYTLCKAYTPRELYEPSYAVIAEVQRRGVNCGGVYTYRSLMPAVEAANDAYDSVYGDSSDSSHSYNPPPGLTTCVYKAGAQVWAETYRGVCPISSSKGGVVGSLQRY
jgi:hypothetical protein